MKKLYKKIKEIFKEKEWSDRDYFFIGLGSAMATIVVKGMSLFGIDL